MNLRPSVERFISCLLAQLRLDQNGELVAHHGEHHRRFAAVMSELERFHQEGRALELPLLEPLGSEYLELEALLLYWVEVLGWANCPDNCDYVILLTLTSQEAQELLTCLTRDELDVVQWLAGIYTNPALAGRLAHT